MVPLNFLDHGGDYFGGFFGCQIRVAMNPRALFTDIRHLAQVRVESTDFGSATEGRFVELWRTGRDDCAGEVCAGEVDFEALLAISGGGVKVKPIPRFPAIVRDLSLIVDEKVQWADITEVVGRKAPAELASVEFGGIYRGKPIEAGKKSVTISLCFRDADGTLRHEIVDGFQGQILEELEKYLGSQLRTV